MKQKYRKKPVVIEAVIWNGSNQFEMNVFVNKGMLTYEGDTVIIPTLEGQHIASRGDYIIRGVKGECYPCKPDIFYLTYELVID